MKYTRISPVRLLLTGKRIKRYSVKLVGGPWAGYRLILSGSASTLPLNIGGTVGRYVSDGPGFNLYKDVKMEWEGA